MMLAWLSSSERMKSSLPRMEATVPALAAKPDWKTTQASTFLKAAIFSSSSMWMRMVPAMVRTAPEPTPYLCVAAMAASSKLGVVAEAEVVVDGEVDDLLAVVGADGGLLVVEHAQFEVGAALRELVELGGEVGELGAGGGRGGHRDNRKPFVCRTVWWASCASYGVSGFRATDAKSPIRSAQNEVLHMHTPSLSKSNLLKSNFKYVAAMALAITLLSGCKSKQDAAIDAGEEAGRSDGAGAAGGVGR